MTKVATRWVPTRYKVENGRSKPYWESVCSPESFKVRARCLVPPQDVVLVLFVPGVMAVICVARAIVRLPGYRPMAC